MIAGPAEAVLAVFSVAGMVIGNRSLRRFGVPCHIRPGK
jgi:hypothetical protein